MKISKNTNTEQAIIEVAEKLFLEKGFALTSTTEIAKEVGCNQALVHYYFRTKDKLFEAIFEKKIRMFVSAFIKKQEENLSFQEKLTIVIESHFDMLKANPKIPFLFFNELTTNPKRLISLKDKIIELPGSVYLHMEKELQHEIKKGTIRPISAIDLLISIFSLNVMLFIASPIIKTIGAVSDEEFNKIIENRKKENVYIILKSIEPTTTIL